MSDNVLNEEKISDRESIYTLIEEEINNKECTEAEKEKKLRRINKLRKQQINIMLVGSTGSGKSSTVNALFDMRLAKVGEGANPETKRIAEFRLDNMTVWDTPGLGDGVEKDQEIADKILLKLQEKNDEGKQLIDIVVIIMDASTKDLGTYYTIINEVLIPEFGEYAKKKIVLALNQSDLAMKGNHWNDEENKPDEGAFCVSKEKGSFCTGKDKGKHRD